MYTTWALTKASKCVFLDEALYNYKIDRSSSIMNVKLAERRFQNEIPFWKEQIGYLYGLGEEELAKKASGFQEAEDESCGKAVNGDNKRGKG